VIISGIQTGNTRWLAAHLQNAADNELIDVVEVTGTVATDIDGALAEFDAIASGTKATEGVYAAFINPPVPLTRAQYLRAIDHIAGILGLTGQPRIVLFHIKKGREHCHIVWSRIDALRMRAIHLAHDRQKLRRCAKELAAEFGTILPPGLAEDRGTDRFLTRNGPTRAEKAMEAATGLSRNERIAVITDCYFKSDSAEAFINALEAAGFLLARGDRRAFVVVDTAGETHSLARQIDGARTADVKKKLEGLNAALLPPADRARLLMQQRAVAQADVLREHRDKEAEAESEWKRLSRIQTKRRVELDRRWQVMKIRHMHEWKVLLAHTKAKEDKRLAQRHWLAAGLAAYMRKIIFIRDLVEYYEKRERRLRSQLDAQLKEAVRRRHENEAAELQRFYEAIARLCRRESVRFCQRYTGTTAASVVGSPLLLGEKIYSAKYVAKVAYTAPILQTLDIDAAGLAATAIMFAINSADITESGGVKFEPEPEFIFSPVISEEKPIPIVDASAWGLNLSGLVQGESLAPAVSFAEPLHRVGEDQRVKFDFIELRADI
jgi:hypothetical protein